MRLAGVLLIGAAVLAEDRFAPYVYHGPGNQTLPYRLYTPAGYENGARYPLVVFLHGVEALGSDNSKQISGKEYTGSHVWTTPENQAKYPCFVLAPQCALGGVWAYPVSRRPSRYLLRVAGIVDELERRYPIAPDRIYVTGQSLGGFGVWALIGAFPGRFAAAVPVCGGGNTRKAPSLVHLPIWAFHNAGDPVVWVLESRRMIGALRKAGGSPKYTEYPGGLHNSWDRAYHEPELLPWLFAQRNSLTPATTR